MYNSCTISGEWGRGRINNLLLTKNTGFLWCLSINSIRICLVIKEMKNSRSKTGVFQCPRFQAISLYFRQIVSKFLWHQLWIAACAATLLRWLLPRSKNAYPLLPPPAAVLPHRIRHSTNCAFRLILCGIRYRMIPVDCSRLLIARLLRSVWQERGNLLQ